MENLVNMIVKDESPSKISDSIKDILFAKASEGINSMKPEIATSFFNNQEEDKNF